MQKDGLDGSELGDGGQDVTAGAALITAQDVEGEDAAQELAQGMRRDGWGAGPRAVAGE